MALEKISVAVDSDDVATMDRLVRSGVADNRSAAARHVFATFRQLEASASLREAAPDIDVDELYSSAGLSEPASASRDAVRWSSLRDTDDPPT